MIFAGVMGTGVSTHSCRHKQNASTRVILDSLQGNEGDSLSFFAVIPDTENRIIK